MKTVDEYYTQEGLGELSFDEVKAIREMREKKFFADGEKVHKNHTMTQSCQFCSYFNNLRG